MNSSELEFGKETAEPREVHLNATTNIKKYTKLLKDDIIIVVMGPTGSGKSNFIDVLAESHGDRAREGLHSATSAVNIVRLHTDHPVFRNRVILVDTPGFDDTSKTDYEILEIISKFLAKTYKTHIHLSGLLYLHRITDNRIADALRRSLHVFSQICGQQALQNVILVTTMWDEVKLDVGKQREEEIDERFWGTMKSSGANYMRFQNTLTSAWDIVRAIAQPDRKPIVLALQQELISRRKRLTETSAAHALYAPLPDIIAEQDATRRHHLETQTEEEKTKKLLEEYATTQAEIDKLLRELNSRPGNFGQTAKKFFTPLNFKNWLPFRRQEAHTP
ncbi:hypothetical protein D9613_003466 [Agrocybe pediades]|uniref:Septin-type G domain-containing protein n=1 Tax=Agrocybe pediades TaxID=84607 RepID=A0A8H4VNH5_9AGAR|nr:hypothetical protein D9613_003466 [Agrocybe pediades]